MKKILCITIVAVMLLSLFSTAVSANTVADNLNDATKSVSTSTKDEADWLFYQKFYDRFIHENDRVLFYEELYYHYNDDGDLEWVLIHGRTENLPPWVNTPCAVFEDRIIRKTEPINNFHVDYALYLVEEQLFRDLVYLWKDAKYTEDIYNALNEKNIGEVIGDMDKDNKLTIKDATYIQKCIAELISFPENDEVPGGYGAEFHGYVAYISDFNRDGVRNIKDATAIQKQIAGIEY